MELSQESKTPQRLSEPVVILTIALSQELLDNTGYEIVLLFDFVFQTACYSQWSGQIKVTLCLATDSFDWLQAIHPAEAQSKVLKVNWYTIENSSDLSLQNYVSVLLVKTLNIENVLELRKPSVHTDAETGSLFQEFS